MMGGKLFDRVQCSLIKTCKRTLEDKTVSLSLDGCSNVHNEPVVCVSVTTDKGDSFLTETIDTSGHVHTSDYLTQLAENSIKSCGENLNVVKGNVVTDRHAANMTKMRQQLVQNVSSNLLTSAAPPIC